MLAFTDNLLTLSSDPDTKETQYKYLATSYVAS